MMIPDETLIANRFHSFLRDTQIARNSLPFGEWRSAVTIFFYPG